MAIRWNFKNIKDWIRDNRPEFILLEYFKKNNKSFIIIKHKDYKDNFKIDWHSFKSGGTPKYIYNKENHINKSLEHVIIMFKNKGYDILNISDYKNCNSSLFVVDKLGYKYKVRYSSQISNNSKFFKVSNFNPHTIENIKLWAKLNRPEYVLISDTYKGNKSKLKFKYIGDFWNFNEENRIFEMSWSKFHSYQNHPKLSISKLEINTIKFLSKNNIKFYHQKSFKNCKNKNALPFDFYLPEYNLLIEAQGQLHESKYRLKNNVFNQFGGVKGLLSQTKNDLIKKKFCRDKKNPDLLEIWYYEMHQINKILKYKLGL